jgi:hypothetical protein
MLGIAHTSYESLVISLANLKKDGSVPTWVLEIGLT